MRILDYSIWFGSIALEFLLLIRAFRTKLSFRYPIFFSYILFVLTQSFLRFTVNLYRSDLYGYVYWTTEFVGVSIGCAVVFEIYRVGLASYLGTARMARVLLAVLFFVAVAKGLVDVSNDPRSWAEASIVDIERAVRTVQALAIVALVGVFLSYAIPFGRNLKGILLGYGLFVGVSVIWFTFLPPEGYQHHHFWANLGPLSYVLALCLWAVYLWSPQAQPVPASNVRLEEQYQRAAARTRRRLQAARGYLGKVIDP